MNTDVKQRSKCYREGNNVKSLTCEQKKMIMSFMFSPEIQVVNDHPNHQHCENWWLNELQQHEYYTLKLKLKTKRLVQNNWKKRLRRENKKYRN